MSTAAIVAGTAAASIGGAAIASSGAQNAAQTQSTAAEQAQQLQATEAQNSLDFQKQEWNTQQSNMAPWLSAGKGALSNLTGLTSTPGQGLLSSYPGGSFSAPTGVTEQNDPGYQFRMQQGEGALQNSAAANGSLLSGNTLEAQQKYGQDYASNEYSNVYNRALQNYDTNYNVWNQGQTNTYNRLAGIAGAGQQAATTLGSEGQAAANNVANTSLTTGAQQGQQINNAAAATASGYVGSANAWGGALSGSANNLTQLALMQQLFGQSSGATPSWNSPLSANTNAIYN